MNTKRSKVVHNFDNFMYFNYCRPSLFNEMSAFKDLHNEKIRKEKIRKLRK